MKNLIVTLRPRLRVTKSSGTPYSDCKKTANKRKKVQNNIFSRKFFEFVQVFFLPKNSQTANPQVLNNLFVYKWVCTALIN